MSKQRMILIGAACAAIIIFTIPTSQGQQTRTQPRPKAPVQQPAPPPPRPRPRPRPSQVNEAPVTQRETSNDTTQELWVNIYGADVFNIQGDVRDPNTIYATTHRGLYKTTNGGFYWTPLHSVNVGWMTLAQSPSAPDVMYLGGAWGYGFSEGRVWKTQNGGLNWEDISAGMAIKGVTTISVDPTNPAVVYAISGTHLFKTLNAGKSWGDISPEGLDQSFTINPKNPGSLLLISTLMSNRGLQASEDGGLTWHEQEYPVRVYPLGLDEEGYDASAWSWLIFHPTKPNILLGSIKAQHSSPHEPSLVISRDGGNSWKDISVREFSGSAMPDKKEIGKWKQVATPVSIESIEWSEKSDQIIYAGNKTSGLFVTKNGGETWQKLVATGVDTVASTPNSLFVSTTGTLLKSLDEGRSWHLANLGLPAKIDATIECIDPVSKIVYLGANGGYWASEDGSLSWNWHPINTQGLVRQIIVNRDRTIYLNVGAYGDLGTSTATIVRVAPDGSARELKIDKFPNFLAGSPSDSNVLYLTAHEGKNLELSGGKHLLISEDSGFSWRTVEFANKEIIYIENVIVSPQSSKIAYIKAVDRLQSYPIALLATTDGGKTWRDLFPALQTTMRRSMPTGELGPITSLVIDPNNSNVVYAVTPTLVFRSQDGGRLWSSLSSEVTGRWQGGVTDLAVSQSSSHILYIAAKGGIWRGTAAGGGYWQWSDRGLLGDSIRKLVTSPSFILAQGENGIYRLSDDRLQWAAEAWQRMESVSQTAPPRPNIPPSGTVGNQPTTDNSSANRNQDALNTSRETTTGSGAIDYTKSAPGKYVNKDKDTEYIELKPDGTFHLQYQGRSSIGKYEITGDVVTLVVRKGMGAKRKLRGDTMTSDDGKVWVKVKK